MALNDMLQRLRAYESELRGFGVIGLSLFGSTARDEATADSDIDLAATLDPAARIDLFRFAEIGERLRQHLGAQIDLVVEPAREARFQAEIDRDRLRVF